MGTQDELALLHEHRILWVESLFKHLEQTDRAIASARKTYRGSERRTVLEDLNAEAGRIDSILTNLLGPPPKQSMPSGSDLEPISLSEPALQLAWSDGRLIAWSAGHKTKPEDHEQIIERLSDHGASAIEWSPSDDIDLPGDLKAPCVSAPIAATLGWLVSLGATRGSNLGITAIWMGVAAGTAVKLVIEGKMFPLLHEVGGTHNDETGEALFHIRWAPALLDAQLHAQLVKSAPGAVMVASGETDRHKFTGKVISDLTDSIVRMAASQIELPPTPSTLLSKEDVGEMIVSRLDGMAFRAPIDDAADIARRLTQWAVPVTGLAKLKIVVQLDPPDESGTWLARVLVPNGKDELEPIEVTVTTGSEARRKLVNKQVARLERLFPELLRPGGRRRGEVLLSQDEAWELMSNVGEMLSAAGYDVRVPKLTNRKTTPILRITADSKDTVVGAQQIADVRWTAMFDDVELTAEQIRDLASQAKPLIESKGQWVELDKADLAEAAAALAERADLTKMSGAEMLRHALGLEEFALGGISLAGGGWAVELLRSVKDLPEDPNTRPENFVGELRSYQADALAWLDFLENAGLGGCLALDMGLGKTPTTLASIADKDDKGINLVIAPPAVVGNWKAEAQRFVPGVKVLVHHGPSRAKGASLKSAVEKNDLIITTYGTAVRDIDQLEKFDWAKIVLDEAQAIKNPAAETSKQLRRLEAHSRIALTGTPIENGLGDLWSILDWANPGLLGPRTQFIAQLTPDQKRETGSEDALKALNGIMVYRRTKAEPIIAAELPDRIDEVDHCAMTPEQIGLYQAIIDSLIEETEESDAGSPQRKGAVLAAITALKQICNHPLNYRDDGGPIEGRSGKLDRLYELVEN
ncbi:MAG: SNF2-related protein, partial [Acidimicrobiales bacterium]|nr:SNF2-related protein [Acidimicrobiales bacterium]